MTHAANTRITEAETKAREKAGAKKAAEFAQLRKDFNETFAPAAGRNTLRQIMTICGWERSPVVGDQNGNPLGEGTIYNAAQQNVYRAIRKLIHEDILIAVEHRGLQQDEPDIFS